MNICLNNTRLTADRITAIEMKLSLMVLNGVYTSHSEVANLYSQLYSISTKG